MRARILTLLGSPSAAAAFLLTALILAAGPAVGASEPEKLSASGNWTAYVYKEGGKTICYMFSQPIKQEGNFKKRGDPRVMVTRRKGSEVVEEVSVTSGYPYKDQTKVKLQIDGSNITFGIVQEEHAWADDPKADASTVNAMRRGNKLTVRGTSRLDTYSLDTYSLKGFTKIHKAIVKACP
jgi:hypothetical protein